MVRLLPHKEFMQIYAKVPRICVDLIIKSKKGVVLTKRDIPPFKGMWHMPGGTILIGETSQQTAKRIAKHETGLDVKIEKCLGIIEYKKLPKYGHAISIVYEVIPISGTLHGCKEGKEAEYYKKIPNRVIKDQKDFLKRKLKMK